MIIYSLHTSLGKAVFPYSNQEMRMAGLQTSLAIAHELDRLIEERSYPLQLFLQGDPNYAS